MKHKQVFSMNLTGPIDYGFRNNYMFRTALQLSQKALICHRPQLSPSPLPIQSP
jgi:hypothetical protein